MTPYCTPPSKSLTNHSTRNFTMGRKSKFFELVLIPIFIQAAIMLFYDLNHKCGLLGGGASCWSAPPIFFGIILITIPTFVIFLILYSTQKDSKTNLLKLIVINSFISAVIPLIFFLYLTNMH